MSPSLTELQGDFMYDPGSGIILQAGHVAGYTMGSGYRLLSFKKKRLYAHRVAWCLMTGAWPSDEIDHKNGIKDDNRWCNLREANRKENARNQGLRSDSVSGFKGVLFHQKVGRWRAVIETDGGHIHLGYFPSPESASEAYKSAATVHFKEFARV